MPCPMARKSSSAGIMENVERQACIRVIRLFVDAIQSDAEINDELRRQTVAMATAMDGSFRCGFVFVFFFFSFFLGLRTCSCDSG